MYTFHFELKADRRKIIEAQTKQRGLGQLHANNYMTVIRPSLSVLLKIFWGSAACLKIVFMMNGTETDG